MSAIQLTQAERDSALWGKIADHLEARIDSHRRQNDNDKTDIETATLRGKIQEAKSLLSLGKEKPEFVKPKG